MKKKKKKKPYSICSLCRVKWNNFFYLIHARTKIQEIQQYKERNFKVKFHMTNILKTNKVVGFWFIRKTLKRECS